MKTILFIPNWYPSKENKITGSFFREQSIALQDYTFITLHWIEKRTILLFSKLKNSKIRKLEPVNREYNITEYNIIYYTSLIEVIWEKLYDFNQKHFHHKFGNGIGFYNSQQYSNRRRKAISRIMKYNKWNFDYIYGVTSQVVSLYCYLFSQISKKPYILAEHWPFPWPGRTISNLCHDAMSNCDLFLAISNDKIRQVLLQNISLRKIRYLGNLVDETIFKIDKSKSNLVKTFVIVASINFFKNYPMLFKVFTELNLITQIPFKLIIAGYCSSASYTKGAEKLELQVKESSFGNKVEMIRSLKREEMPSLYNRADAFVMTSIQEGQPVSAMEASCCGLPIFSTRCGGVEDYIGQLEGRIYELTDYKSFANGLKEFLENKISFDSEHIRNNCVNRFGKKAYVNNFRNFMNEIDKQGKQ